MRDWRCFAIAVLVSALIGCQSTDVATTGSSAGHRMFRPEEIQWKDAPNSLPPGAQIAILDGDPAKSGPFCMRLKFPDGYKVMPHWHPRTERVTVISGTLNLGFGEAFDAHATHPLPAGTYGYWTPGVRHFAWMQGETVLQLNSIGPWQIDYVHASDDPRQTASRDQG